jgi:hypothetical protein
MPEAYLDFLTYKKQMKWIELAQKGTIGGFREYGPTVGFH